MDIPTAQPFHLDETPMPPAGLRDTIVGNPGIAVSDTTLTIAYADQIGAITKTVDIFNVGTGVLIWYATPSAPWLSVLPYTGVAIGLDYNCSAVACDRAGHLQVTIDPSLLPSGVSEGQVLLQALGTTQYQVITVYLDDLTPLGIGEN
jgi:hypothetical protein